MTIIEKALLDFVKEHLRYQDGCLYWIKAPSWRVTAGARAGYRDSWHGYRQIRINGKQYPEHRIVWLLHNGALPSMHIDHINGIRDDNRIENLRDVPQRVNNQNLTRPTARNSSGFLGVSLFKRTGMWIANIRVNNRPTFLGAFRTPEEAHQAYLTAKRTHHEGNTL